MHARAESVATGSAGAVVGTRWVRRLLIVLGFLAGAWLLGAMTNSSAAQAAPTPPVRPVLPTLAVPVVTTPDVTAAKTPVATAVSGSVSSIVRHVRTVQVIVSRTTRTTALVQPGTILRHVLRIPRATHVLQVTIRRGAPSPATSRTVPDVAHRAGLTVLPTTLPTTRSNPPSAQRLAASHRVRIVASRPAIVLRARSLWPVQPSRPVTPAVPLMPSGDGTASTAHAGFGASVNALFDATRTTRDAVFALAAPARNGPLARHTARPSVTPD